MQTFAQHARRSATLIAALIIPCFAGCAGRAIVEASTDEGSDPSGSGGAPPVDAGVEDAGEDAAQDAGAVDAGEWPGPLCPMDWGPTADITGTGPLGPINVQYAWMGFQNAECSGFVVKLSGQPTFGSDTYGEPVPPTLAIADVGYNQMTGYVGAGETDAWYTTGSAVMTVKAWVEFTRVDPMPEGPIDPGAEYPRTEGTINAMSDGWSFSGSFKAPYCKWMDVYCP
jgi:hypothetical protein